MKMKTIALGLTLFAAQFSFGETLKCADAAVKAAMESNYKSFHNSGGTCGAKLLTAGDYTETYLVCVSDETDPSEYVVNMKRDGCKVQFADAQHDSQSPHFEDDKGLLKTKECSVSDDGKGKAKVICK